MTATTDGRASARYLELGALPSRELEAILLRGEGPDPDALAGWEYRGRNVFFGAERSPILKFIKGFYRDGAGRLMGYNIPVAQDALEAPWAAQPRDDAPRRFGFYLAYDVDPTGRDNAYLQALLLDYGRGGNGLLDPVALLRDYVVRVDAGSDDLLLGKAFLALGPARVPTSYFLLERHRATEFARA